MADETVGLYGPARALYEQVRGQGPTPTAAELEALGPGQRQHLVQAAEHLLTSELEEYDAAIAMIDHRLDALSEVPATLAAERTDLQAYRDQRAALRASLRGLEQNQNRGDSGGG